MVGRVGAALLGLVLLVAAVTKAVDPAAFAAQVTAEGLASLLPAILVVYVALALEAGLGAALLLGVRRDSVLWPTTALVVFFLFLTGRAYYRFTMGTLPAGADCGCFGSLVERTPAEAFWGDLVLLVPPLLLAFVGRAGEVTRPLRGRLAVAALVAVAVVGLAWQAPALPLDDWVTPARPGAAASEICFGEAPAVCLADVAPGLASGEHWVVVADVAAADAFVDPLNALARDPASPAPVVLLAAPPEELHRFTWEWGPAFEVRETPEPLLSRLARQPPRSLRVVDGVIAETIAGLPPGAVAE